MIQSRLSSHIRPHAHSTHQHGSTSAAGHYWFDEHDSRDSIYLPVSRGAVDIGTDTGVGSRYIGPDSPEDVDSNPIASELAQVEKERALSKAYVRSQMQFLMVLASSNDGGVGGEMEDARHLNEGQQSSPQKLSPRGGGDTHTTHTYVSNTTTADSSGEFASRCTSGSKSMAYQAVSMLKSQSTLGVTGYSTSKVPLHDHEMTLIPRDSRMYRHDVTMQTSRACLTTTTMTCVPYRAVTGIFEP